MTAMLSMVDSLSAWGVVALELGCACFMPVLLLLAAIVGGRLIERAHLRHLASAEAELADMILTDTQAIPAGSGIDSGAVEGELVLSSVVLSIDHFGGFIMSLRKIFGGELGRYSRLASRARREAVVRLLTKARARGATAVVNVRFESCAVRDVTAPRGGKGAMVEVLAYGTAIMSR